MRTLLIGLLAAGLVACGDEHDDHHHGDEGLDAHACVHVTGGPAATVAADADFTMAVESFQAHHRIDVTLADLGDDTNGGYVKFTPDEAGDFRFLTTADVALTLHAADDTVIAWETSGAPDGCDGAVAAYQADLEADTEYLLKFGPTSADSVGFVAEHQSDEHSH